MKKIDISPIQDDQDDQNNEKGGNFKSFLKTGMPLKKSPKPLKRTPIKLGKKLETSPKDSKITYSDSGEIDYSRTSKFQNQREIKPEDNIKKSKIFKKLTPTLSSQTPEKADDAIDTIDITGEGKINQNTSLINKDYESILPKILRFCLYQERSIFETTEKLRSLDCTEALQNRIIDFLISEKYISDTRFAYEYVHGKFTLKKWGRNKILYNIAKHRLPETSIEQALKEAIPHEKYLHTLEILANKKWLELGNKKTLTAKGSLHRFLTQKGFEFDLIIDTLKKIGFE